MPRRDSAHCLFVLSFWLLAHSDMFAAAKPDILIIVGVEMGYADVGVHGCKDIPTPNLDALAASGVRVTNACVTRPYLAPQVTSSTAMISYKALTRRTCNFAEGWTCRPSGGAFEFHHEPEF